MRRTLLVVAIVLLAGCTVGLDPGDGGASVDDETAVDDGPATASEANGTLTVHAIDLGQADATLLEGPTGETMLIDTGDWRNDGEDVLAYLDERGIDRIDYLVTTHPHADHIGGHAAVIDHYETEREGIGAVWDPGVVHTSATYDRYLDAVEEHDVTLIDAQAGDEIPMAGVDATVFNPPADPETDDLHENSLAVRIAHGDAAFLFTGDAETGVETRLVEEYGNALEADIYHAGHHGSHTSSSDALLEAVDPRATIVSAAYDSQYDHPHDEALDRFDDHGVAAYWTGVHGTVVFESDGDAITVSTVVDATTDPTSIRDQPPAEAAPTASVRERTQYDLNATADAVGAPADASVAAPATTVSEITPEGLI